MAEKESAKEDAGEKKEEKGDGHWMEHAAAKMKAKGTLGSFGKATPGKIARAKKLGGKQEKKAIFAQNAAKASRKKE